MLKLGVDNNQAIPSTALPFSMCPKIGTPIFWKTFAKRVTFTSNALVKITGMLLEYTNFNGYLPTDPLILP